VTVWWLARSVRDVPSTAEWLSAAEARRTRTMTFTKRRTEFLAARYTAKHAIARLLGAPQPATPRSPARDPHHPTGAPYPVVDGPPPR
jgi:4'-phosphopantetheinyl transferase